MASLDVPAAPATLADFDIEAADDRGADNLFLKLRLGFSIFHPSSAMEASAGQRRAVGLVDARRNRPGSACAILMAGLSARRLGVRLRLVFRKRRRLALQRPQRLFQLFTKTLILRQRLLQLVFQFLYLVGQCFLLGRTHPPYATLRREICPAPRLATR